MRDSWRVSPKKREGMYDPTTFVSIPTRMSAPVNRRNGMLRTKLKFVTRSPMARKKAPAKTASR